MALIVDTSVLLAALDRNDPDHKRCVGTLSDINEDLAVPALVLAEVDYWCHERLNASVWLSFLEDVLTGAYRVEPPVPTDLARCHELQTAYLDLRIGVVDASIIALAERLGELRVATLDRRHFSVVRPSHTAALTLLP